ncbi:chitobiase/beta-hexosaminidase C-terminal domain-containing protein [Clostridia bacterium OttesenSCG-928-O13]|nr:chitobiase/beta-hexosaminidase C-terminal domain-containing protein [Clostridia bacterium OttesenSCG-928-O13]
MTSKRRRLVFGLALVLAAALLCGCAGKTTGLAAGENSSQSPSSAAAPALPIEASVPPGTYTEAQQIALATDAGDIYYSLDGTVPTAETIAALGAYDAYDYADDTEIEIIQNADGTTGYRFVPRNTGPKSGGVFAYAGPIATANAGPTEITAVALDADGQLTEPCRFAYQTDADDYEIIFKDLVIEQGIRAFLDRPLGPILRSDLDGIASLQLVGRDLIVNEEKFLVFGGAPRTQWILHANRQSQSGITTYDMPVEYTLDGEVKTRRGRLTDLEDFRHFANLERLQVLFCGIDDFGTLQSLSSLSRLHTLALEDNGLTDLAPVLHLPQLEEISVSFNPGATVETLAGLPQLKELEAFHCGVEDFSFLEEMPGLKKLNLGNNAPEGLAPLAGLKQLEDLNLANCGLNDLTALEGLASLRKLALDNNALKDLAPLAPLTNLKILSLDDNSIGDLTPLDALADLQDLSFAFNSVTDLGPLEGMKELRRLVATGNKVSELAPLADAKHMQSLGLSTTGVENLAPLAGMAQLRSLILTGSAVSDLEPLAALPRLEVLALGNTPVSDLAPVAQMESLQVLIAWNTAVKDWAPAADVPVVSQ